MNLHDEMSEPPALTRAEQRARKRRKVVRRRRTVALVAIALVILLAGGVGAVAVTRGAFGELLGIGGGDFPGEGTSEVTIDILPGMSASQIANKLVDDGVIKSADPFLKIVKERDLTLQSGRFTLKKEMSSQAAIAALVDGSSASRIVVPEGSTIKRIKTEMKKANFSQKSIDAAIDKKKPSDYGLKVDAPSLEGYLYPATYDVQPESTPETIVRSMVDKTKAELNTLAIDHDSANRILTLASLVQVESGNDDKDRAKVARVFLNRLSSKSQTNGLLQSDATVAYIFGAREDLTTTAEQRKSSSPYNTYKAKGLPPGPINSPGENSVRAAQRPASGDWQFFVAVNPDTGETKFANSYAEHQRNVEEYRVWLREHRASASASPQG